MSDDDLAERWKPAPPRRWSLLPSTLDEARAAAREGVFAALIYVLIGFWTIVASLGAPPTTLLLPSAILVLSFVAGVALWIRQQTWAAALLGALTVYLCLVAALPLLHGALDLMLFLYLGLLVLAGRTLAATTTVSKLRRSVADDSPATFD